MVQMSLNQYYCEGKLLILSNPPEEMNFDTKVDTNICYEDDNKVWVETAGKEIVDQLRKQFGLDGCDAG